MKKLLTILLFTILTLGSRAQIYLEHDYDASTTIANLDISGYKYYLMDVVNNQCRLYNMDHSLWKTISLNVPSGMYLYDIKFVSETLFNSDSQVELAYIYYSYDTTNLYYTYYTKVIRENGQELLSIPGCAYLELQGAGSSGTKLLAYVYDYSLVAWTLNTQVYSVPGSLPTAVRGAENGAILRAPFPNPAADRITIPYELPTGITSAEILLLNSSGQVLRSYTVDRAFHELSIQIAGMPRGSYFYQLKSAQGVISSGKILHD